MDCEGAQTCLSNPAWGDIDWVWGLGLTVSSNRPRFVIIFLLYENSLLDGSWLKVHKCNTVATDFWLKHQPRWNILSLCVASEDMLGKKWQICLNCRRTVSAETLYDGTLPVFLPFSLLRNSITEGIKLFIFCIHLFADMLSIIPHTNNPPNRFKSLEVVHDQWWKRYSDFLLLL